MKQKKAYVVGDSVSSSLSPYIFLYWFKKYNINNATYDFIEIKKTHFESEFKKILNQDCVVGLNVTIPYKERVFSFVDNKKSFLKEVSPPINCLTILRKEEGGAFGQTIYGQNTDTEGFEKTLYNKTPFGKTIEKNCCAIVLGYGGAAKAIIKSLTKNPNFKEILVFNRTFEKIKNLKDVFGQKTKPHKIEELKNCIKKADLIINTTPTNMMLEIKQPEIQPKCYGFDIVYRPWQGTGFLKNFKKENRIYGIYMLVYQAVPCFNLWFGIRPEVDEKMFHYLYKILKNKK